MPIDPVTLFRKVGLTPDGPARWGAPVRAPGPGVLVVEWPAALDRAPVDISAVGSWIARVPTLCVDGERPTGKGLAARLGAWWLPGETIVYIGAARSVGRRIEGIATTPLGDARPTAAGQWIKALARFDGSRIWWALTPAFEEYEDAMLEAFAGAVPEHARAALPAPVVVLPFANRRRTDGTARPDGVTGSTVEPAVPAGPAAPGAALRRRPTEYSEADLARLNDLLQRLACGEPSMQITPSQANAEGAVRRLLGEDPSRPPSALGQLLRAGRIEGARQDLDARWSIRCTRRGD